MPIFGTAEKRVFYVSFFSNFIFRYKEEYVILVQKVWIWGIIIIVVY